MSAAAEKSVITCDLEGRILTFNEGAARVFGYAPEEVVGKKRVSLFSPGEIVLEHVPKWLAEADRRGAFSTRTVFLRKDGTPFAAEIRITPTRRGGERLGYCGVTVPLPDVDPATVRPKTSLSTRAFRWLVVTRAPFLTATLVPVVLGAVLAAGALGGAFPWGAFALAFLGAAALHVAANVFNDHFDWTSGTDPGNADYFLPFSGGSRAVELGLVTPRQLLVIGGASLGIAALCGLVLALERPVVLAFGLCGAFAAWFYTAPPLRLAARKGLGEVTVGLCFGPLMTAGTAAALGAPVDAAAFLVGLPAGLLTSAILWINEFPDAPSDARTGKNHLVVVLGKRAARWGYAALLAGAYASAAGLASLGLVPTAAALLPLLALPLAVKAVVILFRHYDDRALVGANKATIQLHLAAGLLFALGLWAGEALAGAMPG